MKAVLNIILKMEEVQNVLPWAVQSTINREFDLYCKSLKSLKKTSPEDLKNLSNTVKLSWHLYLFDDVSEI